ncbi:Twitching mobility protein [subsurface metagenome]
MEIGELLKLMVDKGASDMHLRVPSPPVLRIDGMLVPQEDLSPLAAKDAEMVFEHITAPEQRSAFLREKELDFAYSIPGLARFRVSVMRQRGTISLAFRLVPFDISSIDDLGLPQILKGLIIKSKGLILVTGSAGSGKSTTVAAMVYHLNQNEKRNVITIEDPIEYLHSNHKCIIAQRDIGDDTKSFEIALKHALRHDPDVIVIGEMIDLGTISTAIRAAETGHLVLGILHNADAAQTIDHIIGIFPQDQQEMIRTQLSQVIEAVISQKLLPRLNGGRIAAFEIMVANPEVRRIIRETKPSELPETMLFSGNGSFQSMDKALDDLVKSGIISPEEAISKSNNPEQL